MAIDRHTRSFPRSDRGVLGRQLRDAALSITGNIAEGCGKSSVKETIRFLEIAAGSVSETGNHLLIATDAGYLHPKIGAALEAEITSIRRMLFRLIEHFKHRRDGMR